MTLSNTIEDLLCEFLSEDLEGISQERAFLFLFTLVDCGCDGFEIINRASICADAGNYIEVFQNLVESMHPSRKITDLEERNLRGMIPRWTGTKYHTAKIDFVISDIREKISDKKTGIYSYHSNLNPRRNAVDDPYVLLVGEKRALFLDINRKCSFLYVYQEGGKRDSVGNL